MTDDTETTIRRRRVLHLAGAGCTAALAGCLGGRDDSTPGGDADGGDGTADGSGTGADGQATADWQAEPLEDSTTGETFRIEEFDRPTLVHTFASNCLTCARQQEEFVAFWSDRDDVEIVELSVDPNDTPEDLATHAEDGGLAWHVGVSPEPVTGALIEEFGQEVSISAQSPIIIVCPDGTTSAISKVASPEELDTAIADTC